MKKNKAHNVHING